MFIAEIKKLNKKFLRNRVVFLFFIFFFLYFSIGLFFNFNNDNSLINSVSVFNSDTNNFYYDLLLNNYIDITSVYRPLQMIIIHPFLKFADAIFYKPAVSFCFIQSVFSALTVLVIHKIIYVLTHNKKLSFLLSLLFGISMPTLIFTAIPEAHVFSVLSNSLLLLYVVLLPKKQKSLKAINFFTVFVLAFLAFGITPVSIFTNVIIILYMLVNTQEFNFKNVLKSFLIILSVIGTAYFSLNLLQKTKYPDIPLNISQVIINDNNHENTGRIKSAIRGNICEPLYSLETEKSDNTDNKKINYKSRQNLFYLLPGIILWVFGFMCNLRGIKSGKKTHPLIWVSLLIIFTNIILCYHYAYNNCFLYSRNIFPYIFILLGLMFNGSEKKSQKNISPDQEQKPCINCFDTSKHTYYKTTENTHKESCQFLICTNKYIYPFLLLFVIFQCIINYSAIFKAEQTASIFASVHYHSYGTYLFYSAITAIILVIIFLFLKNIIDKRLFKCNFEEKYYLFIKIFLLFTIICTIFPLIFKNLHCVEL